jgi:hypothetical protein
MKNSRIRVLRSDGTVCCSSDDPANFCSACKVAHYSGRSQLVLAQPSAKPPLSAWVPVQNQKSSSPPVPQRRTVHGSFADPPPSLELAIRQRRKADAQSGKANAQGGTK